MATNEVRLDNFASGALLISYILLALFSASFIITLNIAIDPRITFQESTISVIGTDKHTLKILSLASLICLFLVRRSRKILL